MEKLNNGAIVLEARGDYVLAFWPGHDNEFVTWRRDAIEPREVYSGHYFDSALAAALDFDERTGRPSLVAGYTIKRRT